MDYFLQVTHPIQIALRLIQSRSFCYNECQGILLIKLNFFGLPSAMVDDKSVKLLDSRAYVLLAYLVLSESPMLERRKLAFLLWEDYEVSDGLKSLSNLIYKIIKVLGKDVLKTNLKEIGIGEIYCESVEYEKFDFETQFEMLKNGFLRSINLEDYMEIKTKNSKNIAEIVNFITEKNDNFKYEASKIAERLIINCIKQKEFEKSITYLEFLIFNDFNTEFNPVKIYFLTLGIINKSKMIETSKFNYQTYLKKLNDKVKIDGEIVKTIELAESKNPLNCQKELEKIISIEPSKNEIRFFRRQKYWDQLTDAFQQGKTVGIYGDNGVGKTRMVREFIKTQGKILEFSGQIIDQNIDYVCLVRTYEHILKIKNLKFPEDILKQWSRFIPSLVKKPLGVLKAGEKQAFFDAVYRTYLIYLASLKKNDFEYMFWNNVHLCDLKSVEAGIYMESRCLMEGLDAPSSIFAYETTRIKEKTHLSFTDWKKLKDGFVLIKIENLSEDEIQQLLLENNLDLGLSKILFENTNGKMSLICRILGNFLKNDKNIEFLSKITPELEDYFNDQILSAKNSYVLAQYAAVMEEILKKYNLIDYFGEIIGKLCNINNEFKKKEIELNNNYIFSTLKRKKKTFLKIN